MGINITQRQSSMHSKIMKKAASDLKKDASHYKQEMKKAKTDLKKKHERTEMKEALSASKDMKKRAKAAHEY